MSAEYKLFNDHSINPILKLKMEENGQKFYINGIQIKL